MHFVTSGRARIPALGLGTHTLHGRACVEAVRQALDVGYRHIDTASEYGNEREVGRGMEDAGVPRDEIFLTTKVWWDRLRHDDVLASATDSLEQLATEYVDLLLIHWPNDDVPLSETLTAMQQLVDEGRVRHIGVSNFTPPLLQRAVELADVRCLQVEYHPFLAQDELLTLARRHQLVLTAYSPLAQGKVLGNATLRDIGNRYGTSPAQVALRWLVQQERVAAIPRSASAEHRSANLRIFDFALTDEEMRDIAGLARGDRMIDPAFAPAW